MDQTGELVIDSMRAEDAALLETLIRHEPDDVMQRLLVHTVPAIAASAAISFSVGAPHGPTLPAEWQTSWRRAIQTLRIDHPGRLQVPGLCGWSGCDRLGRLTGQAPAS